MAAAWALLLLPGPAAGATAAAPPPVYPVPQSETVLGGTGA